MNEKNHFERLCINFMLAVYFLSKKNCLYIEFFLSFKLSSKMFLIFVFLFVFFIFIRIIESIESFNLNHNIMKFDKIFESFLFSNNKISSVFESSLSSNQSDRIYLITTSLFNLYFSSLLMFLSYFLDIYLE